MNSIKKYLRRLYIFSGKNNISAKAMLTLFTALLVGHINTARAIDISDEPMETQVQSAAANIMFVLDNSGSMDWEFLTDGTDGKFEGSIEYLFDDPGDNTYTWCCNDTILPDEKRGKWKSQWSGYNKIFYDPSTAYLPWPQTTANPHVDADVSNPMSNPEDDTHTFDLTAEYYSIESSVIVDNIIGPHFEISDGGWSTSTGNEWGANYHYKSDAAANHWAKWIPIRSPGPSSTKRPPSKRKKTKTLSAA